MNLDLKNYQNRHSLRSKIGRVVWNVVWVSIFLSHASNGWM